MKGLSSNLPLPTLGWELHSVARIVGKKTNAAVLNTMIWTELIYTIGYKGAV